MGGGAKMKKNIVTISPGFEDVMPEEYRELVKNGPYGRAWE